MKIHFYILFSLLFYFGVNAQDTTRVLFIGNSFTYGNNMPQLFKAFADSAHIPVIVGMHAPPGVSVGDTIQGTMAHMYNPALFALIRSQKWDYAVIQDNQGRFIRDSAVFSPGSKVVQGHLNIMDSVKANNPCAKIILFGGWAWKFGSPPFGNTGIESIQRILCNYRVLNDTMKEVVAPIGEAWIKAFNYLPAVNLWDVDDAHPSYEGSFLTASVIFSTIFNLPVKTLNYNGSILAANAYKLRAFGDSVVFGSAFHSRYNLGGIKKISLNYTNGQLSVPGTYSSYNWYKKNVWLGNASTLNVTASADHRVEVTETDGCILKTCGYTEIFTTAILNEAHLAEMQVFPNPVTGGSFTIKSETEFEQIILFNVAGISEKITAEKTGKGIIISTQDLKPGCYVLQLTFKSQTVYKKIIIYN